MKDRMSIWAPGQDEGSGWDSFADRWSDMWANRGQQEQAPAEQAQPHWRQILGRMNAQPWDGEAMREQLLNRMQAFRNRYGNQG